MFDEYGPGVNEREGSRTGSGASLDDDSRHIPVPGSSSAGRSNLIADVKSAISPPLSLGAGQAGKSAKSSTPAAVIE